MESQKCKRKLPEWMKGRSKNQSNLNSHENVKKSMLNLPLLEYPGNVIYSYNKDDCALICDDIRNTLQDGDERIVGFDLEWPVTYSSGREPKTALIQICLSYEKCFLFHISCMPDIPRPLKDILLDQRLQKAGVGIENDFWKLGRDFDIDPVVMIKHSMRNLTSLANQVLGTKENWSLDNLCKHVLMKTLQKDSGVRCSDWAQYPLSDQQIKYAAADAYAGLLLYEELNRRKQNIQELKV